MCGFFAAFTKSVFLEHDSVAIMKRLALRGPDAEGLFTAPGVTMGHRRLAILDLDGRSSQPMESICGRYVIVFNGEIYNYRELREELKNRGCVFRTDSDTEVILNLYIENGEAMLEKLMGMFSLVIWDREISTAFIARDPYGIKPLYYASLPDGIVVASQVKALLSIREVSRELDPLSKAFFWMLGSVPEPKTWFNKIKMVPAGSFMRIQDSKISHMKTWCDIAKAWSHVEQNAHKLSSKDIFEKVRVALLESVSRHMVSDVPVAVLLSGGIDSGAIVALMRELEPEREIVGVTVVYDEFVGTDSDETEPAKLIADLYSIKHCIVKVTQQDFISDLPLIMDAMDQPSVDGINTWYATKAVAELGIKVVISGVGGDELFLGYPSFRLLPGLVLFSRYMQKVPAYKYLAQFFLNWKAVKSKDNRWSKALDWLTTIQGAWWLRRSILTPNEALLKAGMLSEGCNFSVNSELGSMVGELPRSEVLGLAQIESKTYLRNQLLRDADWASMYHGVELRTPLVDANLLFSLAPFLNSFPRYKNKVLLARAPKKPLPESIIFRGKTGFGIPVNRWINYFHKNDTFDKYQLMRHIEASYAKSSQ